MGFWQFGDRLLLDVYVPLSFATIVDMHIWVNRSANPSVFLETTRNNSKLFRQGLWSHLLHQLILVRAAAYWQLSHLLPADVRDALAGHDELQVVHAQQGLDAGLAATALHSGTPSCPSILVRRTEAAASCETRRHILSQSQSHKSDMATKSGAKNDDLCVDSICNNGTPWDRPLSWDPPCEFVRSGISLSQQLQRVNSRQF